MYTVHCTLYSVKCTSVNVLVFPDFDIDFDFDFDTIQYSKVLITYILYDPEFDIFFADGINAFNCTFIHQFYGGRCTL